jgi:hypothetical protein
MEDVRDRAPTRKAEIVIPKRSRGRQPVAAQLAYQEQVEEFCRRIEEIRARPPLGGAMIAPSTTVSAAIPLTIVAEPIHDRAWWTEESARVGTGWPAVVDAALEMMVAGGILEPEPDTMTAWDAPSWRRAAVEYHRDRLGRLAVEIEPKRLARLRHLMADDVSLERASHEPRDKRSNFRKGDFR